MPAGKGSLMKIGYARVSTRDQNLDLQREALRGAECTRIFEEKASGVRAPRPALTSALRALRRGDVLVVWKLDRLGRSLQDLIKILADLDRRGIGFRSLSDNFDTTTPVGRLVFHVAGAMAEFERDLMSERTRAGMAAARVKGRQPGRPRRLSPAQVFHAQCLAAVDEMSIAAIATEMKISKTTAWRAVGRRRHSAAPCDSPASAEPRS